MKNTTVLITGAGGSVGTMLLAHYSQQEHTMVRAVERSEQAMAQLVASYGKHTNIQLYLADLLQPESFQHAVAGCDVVIHCAALKHVAIGEVFPERQARENVVAFCNIFQNAYTQGVNKFLLCSTDKAATPTSVMGATKYLLERICLNGSSGDFRAAAVRFANIIGSNGSLIPLVQSRLDQGEDVILRDERMTRYFMHPRDVIELIQYALAEMKGGEIFIGNPSAARIRDVIETVFESKQAALSRLKVADECTRENIDERLVSPDELEGTRKSGSFFVLAETAQQPLDHHDTSALLSSAKQLLSKDQVKAFLNAA